MGQIQEFDVGGKSAEGYLAFPRSGTGAGVIVLHAWWGLTDEFRRICQRLSKHGFVAFVPDLYHGSTASTIEGAKLLRSALDRTVAHKEMKAATEYLNAHSSVVGDRLGVVGFSFGAHLALWLARNKPDSISAVVLFYGTGGGRYNVSEASFMGHFAERDQWGAGTQSVAALERRLRTAGREVDFYVYPDTQHWFFEEDQAEAYDAGAASLAWERTASFLKDHLT
jgi:carboxymethylenebutenolidase